MSSEADTPLETGISSAGTALAACLFAAQLPSLAAVALRGAPIAKLSFLPTLGQAGNFSAWVVYAALAGESAAAVLRVNAIGCGFAAVYVIFFLAYSAGAARARVAASAAAAAAALAALFAGCIFATPDRASAVVALGWAATTLNVAMYASPIAGVRAALRSMDRGAIPVLLVLAGLGCSVLWGLYGLLKRNYFVGVPNAIGVVLSALQLVVAAYIYLGTSAKSAAGDDYAALNAPGLGEEEDGETDGLSFAEDASTVRGSVSGTLDRGLLR